MGQPICAATVVLFAAVFAVCLSHCTYQNYHIICTYETLLCSTEYRSSWGRNSVPILKGGIRYSGQANGHRSITPRGRASTPPPGKD